MASIYDIKPAFQALLRPVVRALATIGMTPNQVTLAAMVLSLALGGAIAAFPGHRLVLLLIPAGLFARMALNAIDGMLAREHDMKTRLGAVLNELGDVLSDAALYLPLVRVPGFDHLGPFPVAGVVVLAVISEMTGVLGQTIGGTRRYDGPMGKSDRAFVFGAIALAIALGVPADARVLGALTWLDLALLAILVLLVVTIVNRATRTLADARRAEAAR